MMIFQLLPSLPKQTQFAGFGADEVFLPPPRGTVSNSVDKVAMAAVPPPPPLVSRLPQGTITTSVPTSCPTCEPQTKCPACLPGTQRACYAPARWPWMLGTGAGVALGIGLLVAALGNRKKSR